MPTPKVYSFPVKRPSFITSAIWNGDDHDLELQIGYTDENGNPGTVSFPTENPGEGTVGQICLPTGKDVNDLDRDTIIAHVRMATFISGTIAGSAEWEDAFVDQDVNHFQMAIGTCKVNDIRALSDVNFEFDFKKTSGGPIRTLTSDHSEMSNYTFTPSTQLLIVPGSIEKQFSGYVHDYPGTLLNQTKKDDIVSYVLGLQPWV